MDGDDLDEVFYNMLTSKSSTPEMDSDEEEVFPTALNSKKTGTRAIDCDSDVEEVFPTTLTSKSTASRELDCDSDVEEVFPTALSSKSTATRKIGCDRDVKEVASTALNYKSTATWVIDCDSDVEVVLPTALNFKSTATRKIDGDSDVQEVAPTALNSKLTATQEIDCDSDVGVVLPTALNFKSTATRKVDCDSDVEEVSPNAKLLLTADGKRLFRIRRTVMEMLRDRGYLVSNSELMRSPEQFCVKFGEAPNRENLKFCTAKTSNPEDRILVILPKPTGKDKVGKPTIDECAGDMKANDTRRAILVVQKPLTTFAKQSIAVLDKPYELEVFQETELLVNLMDSVFVPKHQILLPEEKKALMEKYKINSDGKQQLPILQKTDPVARYLGLEKGQVVRIIRPGDCRDPSAQHQAMYRIVT